MKEFKPNRTESITKYWTDKFEHFEFFPSNRKIIPKQVEILKESINEKGFLPHFNIVVMNHIDKNKFYILSGQHRFKASQELGTEFAFTITDKTKEHETIIADHQGLMRDWSLEDILKYWSEKGGSGFKSYRDLTDFLNTYNFPISVALQFLVGLDLKTGKPMNENYLKDFKLGRLKISKNKLHKADDIADRISSALSIKSLGRHAKSTSMLKSLYMLIHAENFSEQRLLHVFRTTPQTLTITSRRFDETLECLIDIFNGTMKRKRIEFNKEFSHIYESLEKQRKRARRRTL